MKTWVFSGQVPPSTLQNGVPYTIKRVFTADARFSDAYSLQEESDTKIGVRTRQTISDLGAVTNYLNPAFNSVDDDPIWYLDWDASYPAITQIDEPTHFQAVYVSPENDLVYTVDIALTDAWRREDAEGLATTLASSAAFDSVVSIYPTTGDTSIPENVWFGLDASPVPGLRTVKLLLATYQRGVPGGLRRIETTGGPISTRQWLLGTVVTGDTGTFFDAMGTFVAPVAAKAGRGRYRSATPYYESVIRWDAKFAQPREEILTLFANALPSRTFPIPTTQSIHSIIPA